jgi:uncharacterized protein (DUF58 family)
MIVPRTRLLFWVAIVVPPFLLLGAVEPTAAVLSSVILGGFTFLTLVDAMGARRRLVGLGVEVPAVVRMSKDREAKLGVRIRNERLQPQTLRLALALPRELPSPQLEAEVALPRESEWSQLNWSCRPCKRGSYRLETVHLETTSPLGFWGARKAIPARSEIRVYPNLVTERRSLAGLFLHRGSFGLHTQRQVGKGREFEKLREYVAGDSFDEVHWKATAKRGRPITKVFQIERTQEIYVVIDASRMSARPVPAPRHRHRLPPVGAEDPAQPGGLSQSSTAAIDDRSPGNSTENTATTSTLDRFITAALLLGLAAEQQGDLFGLLTFTSQIERFVRAKNGQAHYSMCRDALYTLEPRIVAPDFDEVCAFIRLRLRRRALLVFLTALDDPVLAESFVRNVDVIRRQHLVLVHMLQPQGVAPLFSDANVRSVDDLYEHLGGHIQWQKLRELERVLHRRGVRFSMVRNEDLTTALVAQYLGVKKRQAL